MARSAMRPKAGFYLGLADSHREATPPVQRSQRRKTIMEALYETTSDAEASDDDETAGARDEASPIVKDAPYPKKLTIVLTDRCNLKCFICQRDEYEQALGGFGQLLDLNNLSHLDEAIKAAQIIDITGYSESDVSNGLSVVGFGANSVTISGSEVALLSDQTFNDVLALNPDDLIDLANFDKFAPLLAVTGVDGTEKVLFINGDANDTVTLDDAASDWSEIGSASFYDVFFHDTANVLAGLPRFAHRVD